MEMFYFCQKKKLETKKHKDLNINETGTGKLKKHEVRYGIFLTTHISMTVCYHIPHRSRVGTTDLKIQSYGTGIASSCKNIFSS